MSPGSRAPGQAPVQAASDAIACRNLRWSLALLAGLEAAGMRDLVISPGSRSTPVILAAQRRPWLRITPILDERSAAFFALGLARAAHRPVALLATSGSAPAHWYPAVIEASEWGAALILLSADRPPRLRGFGANQTIDQTRLFGHFTRESHDPGLPDDRPAALKAIRALGLRAGHISRGPRPGPVQINLPFDEPLVPVGDCGIEAATELDAARRSIGPRTVPTVPPMPDWPKGRGIIVCGPGAHSTALAAALDRQAHCLGLPVLADPLSGLRFGAAPGTRISGYDSLLRNPQAARALRPDWVLRIGRPAVSKRLGEWLDGVPMLLIDPAGGWSDPSHDLIQRLTGDPAAVIDALSATGAVRPDPDWRHRWQRADERIHALLDAHLRGSPWCEGQLIRRLLHRLPAGDALLCANSMPIRQLDTWGRSRAKTLPVFGNRGVSGIDGQLSTLAGIDAAGGPCWGLLGDLSFCHDLSGLLLAGPLARPVIVINNGGGRIFDYLPQHGLPGFERLWRTPVTPDLAMLAATFGLDHQSVTDAAGFDRALELGLSTGNARPLLIEVIIDADLSRGVHQALGRAIAADGAVSAS